MDSIPHKLQQSMRWYGSSDPVGLSDIVQAGCSGVVSALHHIPVGDVWEIEEIKRYGEVINEYGLEWKVVESLPVHEDIKTRNREFKFYIQNYIRSLENLSKCGIRVITYNFMPVLDWVRTNTQFRLASGAETLYYDHIQLILFDLFILKRSHAAQDYTESDVQTATAQWKNISEAEKEHLKESILLGLPGSKESFKEPELLKLMEKYQKISANQLRANLIEFVAEIAPVADSLGLQLAIHPDDPPFSVLGLPRVVSTEKDVAELLDAVPNASNGLCFCTGSYGARTDNDLVGMIRKFGKRIYFLHLRNTKMDGNGQFYEAPHLEGDADMYSIVREIVGLMENEGRSIPMRPDHGHKMLDDLKKSTYPGYSAIGRLKGLAELRGVEYAVRNAN